MNNIFNHIQIYKQHEQQEKKEKKDKMNQHIELITIICGLVSQYVTRISNYTINYKVNKSPWGQFNEQESRP